jgi:hypothetical protein
VTSRSGNRRRSRSTISAAASPILNAENELSLSAIVLLAEGCEIGLELGLHAVKWLKTETAEAGSGDSALWANCHEEGLPQSRVEAALKSQRKCKLATTISDFGVNSTISEPGFGAGEPAGRVGTWGQQTLAYEPFGGLLLMCGLSACASGGSVAPSPEFLASQPRPNR